MNNNINKNISVWRGNSTPPTEYHLWIKSDGSLYIYNNSKWNNVIELIPISSIDENGLMSSQDKEKLDELIGLNEFLLDYLNRKLVEEIRNSFKIDIKSSAKVVNPKSIITLTITTTKNGINTNVDTITLNDNDDLTKTATGVYTKTLTLNTIGINTFRTTATYTFQEVPCTDTVSIQVGVYNNIIYGWSENSTISDFNTLKNNNGEIGIITKGPLADASGEYTWINHSDGYYYIAIPNGCHIPNNLSSLNYGLEGPIPVFFVQQSNITVDNINYSVYRIADKQAPSHHTIIFS